MLGSHIELIGWAAGANSAAAIQAIRDYTSLGLKEAKNAVELCLRDKSKTIDCGTKFRASQLVVELEKVGFQATQLF